MAEPHTLLPPNISWTADQLGFAGQYMELRQACTGFANALTIAASMLQSGAADRICIVGSETGSVFYDVQEALQIVDYAYFVAEGKIIAQGTPEQIRASSEPFVHQFVHGEIDGPVRFHYPAAPLAQDLGLRA